MLQFDVVELDAGVLVERGVVGGKPKGGLEGPPGLLGVALLQRRVAGGKEVLRLLAAFALNGGFIGDVGLQVESVGRLGSLPWLKFQRA